MSTTFCSYYDGDESLAAFAGHAVYLRRPLDDDVHDGFVGRGGEIEQPFAAAALDLLDEDTAVREADHAELPDEVGRHRPVDLVIEDEPVVEERSQAVAADFDRDRGVSRAFWPRHVVELLFWHIVEMGRRAGPDIADDRNRRGIEDNRFFRVFARSGSAPGQQPFGRDPKGASIALGLVGAIVPAARILRALVGAVGRNRDTQRLGGEPRRLEAPGARHS